MKLSDLKVPATIVGYFFEVLLARELERRSPALWRGSQSKSEKDVVYLPDPSFSFEIKTSGQAGFKVYGNRSYGQKSKCDEPAKKEKSGYYVTANFFHQALTLLRFGWIDAEDWDPQQAPTGQMAGLNQDVYEHKLIAIRGSYRQQAPVRMLRGVGEKVAADFERLGIRTIGDLLGHRESLPSRLAHVRESNRNFLNDSVDRP